MCQSQESWQYIYDILGWYLWKSHKAHLTSFTKAEKQKHRCARKHPQKNPEDNPERGKGKEARRCRSYFT